MPETTEAYAWKDRDLLGSDGEKIGTVADIYEDQETGRPEWALVKSGLFGTKKHFVPLTGASPEGESVRVGVTEAQVKDAPGVEDDGALSAAEERSLYEHYGMAYSGGGDGRETGERDTTRGGPDTSSGRDVSGPETDEAMTRSEEELRVGTESRESGRVRLRKHVVTENVTQTVPVQREEVRLETEPITDANRGDAVDGPDISEEEHEVVLHEERPVVAKETVAKERVKLGKETVTEEQTVSEELCKEQVETSDSER